MFRRFFPMLALSHLSILAVLGLVLALGTRDAGLRRWNVTLVAGAAGVSVLVSLALSARLTRRLRRPLRSADRLPPTSLAKVTAASASSPKHTMKSATWCWPSTA